MYMYMYIYVSYSHTEKLAELCLCAGYEIAENRYIQKQTVNRKEALSVPRIFIQGRFLKPSPPQMSPNHDQQSPL